MAGSRRSWPARDSCSLAEIGAEVHESLDDLFSSAGISAKLHIVGARRTAQAFPDDSPDYVPAIGRPTTRASRRAAGMASA